MPAAQFPAIFAGTSITSTMLGNMEPLTVIKPGDTTRASNTTPSNDPDLQASLNANGTYLFLCYVNYEGAATGTGDLKAGLSGPAGSTVKGGAWYNNATPTFVLNHLTGGNTITAGTAGAAAQRDLIFVGTIVMSSTPGTFAFQWAQNTTNATGTIVHAGSFLILVEAS